MAFFDADGFWDKYVEENILDNYEIIKETFSKKLEIEDWENDEYAIGEIISEFLANYEDAKRFDEILEFIAILKENNRKFYEDSAIFFNTFLVSYYCFHNEAEKLKEVMTEFADNPLDDYDLLLKSLRTIIYYGHVELAENVIKTISEEVITSDQLIGADLDLALFSSSIELENVYNNYKTTNTFDWEVYNKELDKFNFTVTDKFREVVEEAFLMNITEISNAFATEFRENEARSIEKLGKLFTTYSKEEYNMPFIISENIWGHLNHFWRQHSNETKNCNLYFSFSKKKFTEFLERQSGMIMDYRFSSAAILWGSAYVFDFLKTANLINETTYEKNQKLIQSTKQETIKENLYSLWEYNFVHNWEKAATVTQKNLEKEIATFQKYYDIAIPQGKQNELEDYFDTILDSFETNKLSPQERQLKYQTPRALKAPLNELPNIGRNEKVNVEYKDGTVKTAVKFKKVMTDIQEGKCKVIR